LKSVFFRCRSSIPTGRLPIITRFDSSSKESLSREVLTRQSSTETTKCPSADRKQTPPVQERKKMMTNLPKRPPVILYSNLAIFSPSKYFYFYARSRSGTRVLPIQFQKLEWNSCADKEKIKWFWKVSVDVSGLVSSLQSWDPLELVIQDRIFH